MDIDQKPLPRIRSRLRPMPYEDERRRRMFESIEQNDEREEKSWSDELEAGICWITS